MLDVPPVRLPIGDRQRSPIGQRMSSGIHHSGTPIHNLFLY
jgi:hypothetical protein